ncbi:MAG: hypothetical protein M1837_004355 [Sclerophora amabilis]|nr:MAG: hypothetical protein M1837_004355 [Sclerophora amabilis]
MPIRNPFKKGPGLDSVQVENARPVSSRGSDRGFEKAELVGSNFSSTSAVDVKSKDSRPSEYKLSVVNDSGIYLPPSPPEKKGFWHRSNSSATSSNHRSLLNENEPFSISRESFESYRRSFDISARSPVAHPEAAPPRQSLDARRSQLPRAPRTDRSIDSQPPMEEETFEEVGLNDDTRPKKKSIFSRFADSSESNTTPNVPSTSGHRGFHFTGRKRGQSGQGSELGNIARPESSAAPEVTVEN